MLHKRITALIAASVLLLLAGPAAADYASKVIELVNKERTARGLHPLSYDKELTAAAENHSRDMAEHNYFDHTGRDGRDFNERIAAAGYEYRVSGENIAAGQRTPAEVVDNWMKSERHRKNILNPDFCDIGVGYAEAPESKLQYYWTQDFGRHFGINQCPQPAETPSAADKQKHSGAVKKTP
ncbi:MAG: CAP domain-containing protein [Desulfobacterales bacterium]